MGNLILDKGKLDCATGISNCFIDHYMPGANGEFVKLYIYLVRCASFTNVNLSLEQLADTFTCTEGDITRALRYWENLGLLSLTMKSDTNEITGICLKDCFEAPAEDDSHTTAVSATDRAARAIHTSIPSSPALASYTSEELLDRSSNEDVAEIIYIAESYLCKTLSVSDTDTLLYFYDTLGFSVELIDYLIEYCTSHHKTNMKYIKKTALEWHNKGISTVSQAQEDVLLYSKLYYPVRKALGIMNRSLIQTELDYIDKWHSTDGFSVDMICKACEKAIMNGKSTFHYVNGILESWKKAGVYRESDIPAYDEAHKAKVRAEMAAKAASNLTKPKIVSNAFANFEQHNRDFSDLDKKLLATRR